MKYKVMPKHDIFTGEDNMLSLPIKDHCCYVYI